MNEKLEKLRELLDEYWDRIDATDLPHYHERLVALTILRVQLAAHDIDEGVRRAFARQLEDAAKELRHV